MWVLSVVHYGGTIKHDALWWGGFFFVVFGFVCACVLFFLFSFFF